jgi:hypothetical protein
VRNGREMLVVVAPLEWLESLRHDESGETITWLGKQERDNLERWVFRPWERKDKV